MFRKILFILIIFFSITSCTTRNSLPKKITKPSWLINLDGYKNSNLVATGCAYMHSKGLDAQKKLAEQRASASLARQKSTKVKTISNISEKRNNGVLSSSKYNSSSQYETNINVSYKIRETYYDKLNNQYCVLVEE